MGSRSRETSGHLRRWSGQLTGCLCGEPGDTWVRDHHKETKPVSELRRGHFHARVRRGDSSVSRFTQPITNAVGETCSALPIESIEGLAKGCVRLDITAVST